MNVPPRIAFIALLLAGLPATGAAASAEDPIASVAFGAGRVHVVTAGGRLLKAPETGGAWESIPVASSMELPGGLEADDSGTLFHYSHRTFQPLDRLGTRIGPVPTESGKVHGIHRLLPGASRWDRVLGDADVAHVLAVGPKVFALVHHSDQPDRTADILESGDRGDSWVTLPRPPGLPHHLFPDPRVPGRVAARAHGIREMVVHAPDSAYTWQVEATLAWNRRGALDERAFFRGSADAQGVPFIRPTPSTFFEFPTEIRSAASGRDRPGPVSLPSLWIELGPERAFRIGEPVEIPLRVRTGPGFPERPARLWIDTNPSTGPANAFWWIRRLNPDGTPTVHPPQMRAADARATAGWSATPLSSPGTATRRLNLSESAPFTVPGTYRIQIVYDNTAASHGRTGEWSMRIASPVITVEIR